MRLRSHISRSTRSRATQVIQRKAMVVPAEEPDLPPPPISTQLQAARKGHSLSKISVGDSLALQAKLTVNQPDDTYEQEADQMAAQIMGMSAVPHEGAELSSTPATPAASIQRTSNDAGLPVSPSVESAVGQMQGGGQPLPVGERSFFEQRFGQDFSHIRIHADDQAAETARSLNARAFTVGNDIAFDTGEYQPGTQGGRHLLAHELTHTLQQTGGIATKPQQAFLQQPPPELKLPTSSKEALAFLQQVKSRIDKAPNTPIVLHYRGAVVVIMSLPEPYAVQRKDGQTFTDAAKKTNTSASETVINANLFEDQREGWNFGYPSTPAKHSDFRAQGQVIGGGKVVDGRPSSDTFYFSWNRKAPEQATPQHGKTSKGKASVSPQATPDPSNQWHFGQGNPPAHADLAFGGAIPVIIGGLPYGVGNQYKPGAPAGLPATGDPGEKNRQFLKQRNNNGFADQEKRGDKLGKTIMAIERESNLLILVVQQQGEKGMLLSEIRDTLMMLGVDDALSWDGSDSATLVTDDAIRVKPGDGKNNSIPDGIGFRLK